MFYTDNKWNLYIDYKMYNSNTVHHTLATVKSSFTLELLPVELFK